MNHALVIGDLNIAEIVPVLSTVQLPDDFRVKRKLWALAKVIFTELG
jgi:hypothetical protein